MNLSKLFDMQKILDQRIVDQHGLQGEDLLPKKILALQVELGELAGEWRGFKFWSEKQEPNELGYKGRCERCGGYGKIGPQYDPCDAGCFQGLKPFNPLLEEYVDCLHFVLSIGLELGIMDFQQQQLQDIVTNNRQVKPSNVVLLFSGLLENEWHDTREYGNGVCRFFTLGELLGFTWEQIEAAYMDKNKVNHERQENGY